MGPSWNIWCYSPMLLLNMRIIVLIIKPQYWILIQLIHFFYCLLIYDTFQESAILPCKAILPYYSFIFWNFDRTSVALPFLSFKLCLTHLSPFANSTNATVKSESSHYTQWDKSPCTRLQECPCTELEVGKPHTSTLCMALCDFCPWGSFLILTVTVSTAYIIFQASLYSTSYSCTGTFRSPV
jgi:hypothetical protein